MFRTLKSNSPFSAPRDDTARASCGNGPKAISYHLESIKSRLIDLGYSEERGRPRAGQKALKPALSLVLGLGRSQTTAVLGASRKGADTSTFSHKDLEISAAKGLKKAVSKFGAALVGQRGAKATEKRIALEAVQEAVAELLKLVEGEEE